MADWGMILAPTMVRVSFKAPQVSIVLHSLQLINSAESHSGFSDWISQTFHSLSKEQRLDLSLLCEHIPDKLAFDYQDGTIPQVIDAIKQLDGKELRDSSYTWLQEKYQYGTLEEIFRDLATYKKVMNSIYAEKNHALDNTFLEANFALIQQPEALKAHVITTLTFFWEHYLKAEWQRTQNVLQEAVEAFSQQNYDGMSVPEIVEAVTNRNMRGSEYFEAEMKKAENLVFMPSPHIGPYVGWLSNEKAGYDIVIFGAHLPKNTPKKSKALNNFDLLIQINALADETRLRMLEMLSQEEEICAQDFITSLDLSQSSASRHLRQLTASGYITERRRDVAKCYTLNRDRVKETMKALGQFLE